MTPSQYGKGKGKATHPVKGKGAELVKETDGFKSAVSKVGRKGGRDVREKQTEIAGGKRKWTLLDELDEEDDTRRSPRKKQDGQGTSVMVSPRRKKGEAGKVSSQKNGTGKKINVHGGQKLNGNASVKGNRRDGKGRAEHLDKQKEQGDAFFDQLQDESLPDGEDEVEKEARRKKEEERIKRDSGASAFWDELHSESVKEKKREKKLARLSQVTSVPAGSSR